MGISGKHNGSGLMCSSAGRQRWCNRSNRVALVGGV